MNQDFEKLLLLIGYGFIFFLGLLVCIGIANFVLSSGKSQTLLLKEKVDKRIPLDRLKAELFIDSSRWQIVGKHT